MLAMDILDVIYHLPAPAYPTLAGPLLSVASLMTVCTLEKQTFTFQAIIDIQKLSFDCFKIISHNQV